MLVLWLPPAHAQNTEPDAGTPSEELPRATEAPPETPPPLDAPPLDAPPPEDDLLSGSNQDGAPPSRRKSWAIEGELLESESIVRGFLQQLMDDSENNWSGDDQDEVVALLFKLGYHCKIANQALPTGGTRAVLHLTPVRTVRRIEVEIAIGIFDRAQQPIFRNEIRRRMNLRPGSALAQNANTRSGQLQADAERLQDFLIDDGFFEAEVALTEVSDGAHASRIKVRVVPGPPYFVGKINVVGSAAMEAEDVEALFRHGRLCLPLVNVCMTDRRFSRQELSKDMQRLVKKYQKRFPGVRPKDDYDPRHSFNRKTKTVDLTIDIRERRQVNIVFEGNKRYKDDTLSKQLTFYEVGSYDDVEVEASAQAIRSFYQKRGYFETQVEWETEVFPDLNFQRVLYYITEGPKLRVKRLRFQGNKVLTNAELLATIRTRVYRRIIIGESGGYATSLQLQQDLARILDAYRARGYRDAKVRLGVTRSVKLTGAAPILAAAILGKKAAKGLYVRFRIDEGEKSVVDEVLYEFKGNHVFSGGQLSDFVSLHAGSDFAENKAKIDGDAIQRYYFKRGFPRASVETRFESTNYRVKIVHTIEENSPARIGKIAIRGNFKTSDWVILDELGVKEGDLLTRAVAERAQANLRQSGIFSTVQVTYLGRENPRQEVVNLLVRVEERHDRFAQGSIGGGFSTDSQFFTELGIEWLNLGGIGARLSTRVLVGQQQIFTQASLQLPKWVMRRIVGTDLLLDSSLSYNNQETERFGELTTVGGTVAVSKSGRGFFDGWLLSLRYNFRIRNRDVPLIRPAGNSDDITQTKVTTTSSTFGPYLIVDHRKDREGNRNPLTPGKGYRLELHAVFAENFVLGSNRFVKIGGSGQHYVSIGSKLVFSHGLRYDHGVPLGGDSVLPEVERFFAGGDTTVRGYEEDHLAVEIIENPLAPLGSVTQFRVLPAGGNIRLLHNLDLQLDVWDLYDFPIASAIFVDSGFIANSLVGLKLGDLSHSLGAAVRWVLPIGSLSLEYAVPLTIKTGDNPRGRLHVNLGVLF